ncbi:MAG: hypothetical protein WCA07_15235 [Gloeobacterales cyanobacterium]
MPNICLEPKSQKPAAASYQMERRSYRPQQEFEEPTFDLFGQEYQPQAQEVKELRETTQARLKERLGVLQSKNVAGTLHFTSVKVIKDIIRSSELDDTADLERKLYTLLDGYEIILGYIAMDNRELINVRAMAARLFFARIKSQDYTQCSLANKLMAASIAKHAIPLIRLGVVLGLADARAWDDIKSFLTDPHPKVKQRAEELLEDAN